MCILPNHKAQGLQRWVDLKTAEDNGGGGLVSTPAQPDRHSTLIPRVGPRFHGKPRSSLSFLLMGSLPNPSLPTPLSLDQATSFSHSMVTNTPVPVLTGQGSQPQDKGRPDQSQVQILKEESGCPEAGAHSQSISMAGGGRSRSGANLQWQQKMHANALYSMESVRGKGNNLHRKK